ncbi:fumarate/nitrate reduction transcriptional regulator Fnr [Haliea sp. E17]|uniref:fumarate/nitrate reduction transcriptional regulator Fnr n=1 Tax=Haliea sp. E17 TaxID=3401576 RepID=UPI003AAE2E77
MREQSGRVEAIDVLSGCDHSASVRCGDCRLSGICLPLALDTDDVDQLDRIIQRGRPLRREAHLFREGDAFNAVFAVRSGALKAYRTTRGGQEQVTGFYLPGEIVGLDGIAENRHISAAVALETSAICEIPFSELERLSDTLPTVRRRLMQVISKELNVEQELISLLGKNSSRQRIAALLLSLSRRNARRRLSATRLRLPMPRGDISNYLGLTVETVSRTFTKMQQDGIVRVNNKDVEILDMDALSAEFTAN